jgi:hypothetical protein
MRDKMSEEESLQAMFEIVSTIQKESLMVGVQILSMAAVEAMKDQSDLDISIVKDFEAELGNNLDELIGRLRKVAPIETSTPTA